MTGQEARDNEREALIREARYWPRDGVNEGALINALADEIEHLVARKHPEPEWEYAIQYEGYKPMPVTSEEQGRKNVRPDLGDRLLRRTAPGPWLPVGEGEQ